MELSANKCQTEITNNHFTIQKNGSLMPTVTKKINLGVNATPIKIPLLSNPLLVSIPPIPNSPSVVVPPVNYVPPIPTTPSFSSSSFSPSFSIPITTKMMKIRTGNKIITIKKGILLTSNVPITKVVIKKKVVNKSNPTLKERTTMPTTTTPTAITSTIPSNTTTKTITSSFVVNNFSSSSNPEHKRKREEESEFSEAALCLSSLKKTRTEVLNSFESSTEEENKLEKENIPNKKNTSKLEESINKEMKILHEMLDKKYLTSSSLQIYTNKLSESVSSNSKVLNVEIDFVLKKLLFENQSFSDLYSLLLHVYENVLNEPLEKKKINPALAWNYFYSSIGKRSLKISTLKKRFLTKK